MKKVYSERSRRVFVAMSGGVDSSVAAALLSARGGSAFGGKKQKYDITGVFVKGWMPEGMACGWKDERRDAIRAAAKIGVPLLTFDFSKEYEKKVVEYMKKEYSSGRTPNPDVMCNKYIKFGLFLNKALEMGADYIATGHYVKRSPTQIFYKTNPPTHQVKNFEQVRLLTAKDPNKDQSYFLWTLTQQQLKYCLFPVGNYAKPEVRRLAGKFGLPNAAKKDSQGLCFVGDLDFAAFLRKIIPKKQGNIKTPEGKIVGQHDGVHFYTIGQRHGLKAAGKSPYYIVDKDLKNNVLIVAEKKDEKKFYKKEAVIDETNWIVAAPKTKEKYFGRVRYRQPLQGCTVRVTRNAARVIFDQPQRAVTSGQSLVLYRGNEMLGGGVIV